MNSGVKTFLFLSVLGLTLGSPALGGKPIKAPDLVQIADDAYVFGYPLVIMEITRKVMTNYTKPVPWGAPINQFAHVRAFPRPEDKAVVRPNVDTLYSIAWLDLAREPVILHLPDIKRYYLIQMLDAWTNTFAAPGTRTIADQGGDYAMVGPGWKGKLPAGVKKIPAPTNTVWIIGRILTRGQADYAAVNAIQDQITLTPLSAWGKKTGPAAPGKVDPQVDMKTPPVKQVAGMKAATFFKTLAQAMKTNPPAPADAPVITKLAALGIVPGKDFAPAKLNPAVAQALEAGAARGQKRIADMASKLGVLKNGWQVIRPPVGTYGTAYDPRAGIALFGLGANLIEDAFYPSAFLDQEGKPLTGKSRYVLHFDKDKLPPVNAFWSLTMYGADSFLVPNSLERYARGDRDSLKFNPDGSLDLYLQNQSPGPDKEANWLPAPAGEFNVTLRLYWPQKEVLEGAWTPPGLRRVE